MAFKDVKSLTAKVAAIAKQAQNMQEKQSGGGDYTPPPAGRAALRLVAYVELGKHKEEFKGEVKIRDKVQLTFELHGKNYPVREVEGTGEKIPYRINVTESLSLNEKAHFFKLFNAMRGGREDITHMAQMLGEAFLGTVFHQKSKDGQRTYAKLRNEAGYSIAPPYVEDPETGETRKINVPAPISELRLFVWDLADQDQWDSLFIDGEYEEGKSKNVFQEKIQAAVNFEGSPIQQLLEGGEVDEEEEFEEEEQEAPPPKPKAPAKPKGKPAAAKRDEEAVAKVTKGKAKKSEPAPEAEWADDDIPF